MPLHRTAPARERHRLDADTIANFLIFTELALLLAVGCFGAYKPDFTTKVDVAKEFIFVLANAVIYFAFQAAGGNRDPLETAEMKTDIFFSIVPLVAHVLGMYFLLSGELRIPKGYDADVIKLYYWWWGALMGSTFVVVLADTVLIGSQMYRVTQLVDDTTIRIDPT